MNDAEILKEAIQKAQINGYLYADYIWIQTNTIMHNGFGMISFKGKDAKFKRHQDTHYFEIILSHSFAKVFFGDKKLLLSTVSEIKNPLGGYVISWQYHLQQMVLEEEPLKYLERFL